MGRLRFIHHARLFGPSLAGIRELLALVESKGCRSRQPEYRKILRRHLDELDECVRHLLGLRAAIENLMSPARQTGAQECSGLHARVLSQCNQPRHLRQAAGGNHVRAL